MLATRRLYPCNHGGNGLPALLSCPSWQPLYNVATNKRSPTESEPESPCTCTSYEDPIPLSVRILLRLPHHDIHSDVFLSSLQVYLLDDFEAHFPVNDGIDIV